MATDEEDGEKFGRGQTAMHKEGMGKVQKKELIQTCLCKHMYTLMPV